MNTIISFLGIAVIVAALALKVISSATRKKNTDTVGSKAITGLAVLVGVGLFVAGNAFIIVPTGYAGVRSTFGQIASESVPAGFNWKLPFVQDITLVNTKQQDVVISTQVWGESSEKTPVYADAITVSYQIMADKAAWICANVSNDADQLLTVELVSSAIKSAMVELDTNSVTVRSKVEPLALEMLRQSVTEKYGENVINIIKVTINQMDFEDSYNEAIAAKSIARQTQEKQAIENQTSIAKAEAEKSVAITNAEAAAEKAKIEAQAAAEVKKIEAEAEAEAIRIKAEAEAEANEKLAASLTDEVLKQKFYEAWNGELPQVMSDSTVITDLGE